MDSSIRINRCFHLRYVIIVTRTVVTLVPRTILSRFKLLLILNEMCVILNSKEAYTL